MVSQHPEPWLEHGGRLDDAVRRYGIPRENWIDLSTGISPWSWPTPAVPETVWQRLPEEGDDLLARAAAYYGCNPETLVAIPGSQFAICQLPLIASEPGAGRVAIPRMGYQEHALRWQRAGHQLVFYEGADELAALVSGTAVDHAVVINPNNPTGELVDHQFLVTLARSIRGMLVVDEAFMDTFPQHSLMGTDLPNLVILRSLGKFFGLAGLRLGFASTSQPLATTLSARLSSQLGPWAINHPARWLASRALADRHWQDLQQQRLGNATRSWQACLAKCLPQLTFTSSRLFVSAPTTARQGAALYEGAAKMGLLLRLLLPFAAPQPAPEACPAIVRLALPHESQLDTALRRLRSLESCI